MKGSKFDYDCLDCASCPAAGSILSKMDKSVSPCDDFYTFSCGGWLKENPIPEDSSSYGIYPWLRQHVDIRLKGLVKSHIKTHGWGQHKEKVIRTFLSELLEAPMPPDELEAVRKAKMLYLSCMNESESVTFDILTTST